MAVNKISEQEKTLIRNDSVLSLPDRPSEKGYTAQQLKEYFTNIVLGENGVITELDRIVEEINAFIGDIGDENVKNYILDSIINKFVEQAPYISLSFEDNKLKYTKFGTPNITGELDIIPSNSVFNTQSTLTSKNGETIYPKTTLDNLVDTLDDKSVKEYILNLNTRINELLSKHNTEISELNSNIEAIIGGDAPEALDTIRELAEALKNNPSQIDDILQQISNLSSGKVDKVAGKELTTNDYTNADKSFVSELKNKNLATMSDIPTDLSSFNEDSNHRLTTDTEKEYWNSKANGVHTHETNDINGLQTALDDKSNKGHTHTLEQLNAEEKGVASSLVTEHNNDTEAHIDIRTKLNEVENKVNGINSAISFENQLQLTDWLGGTYSRVDGKLPSDLFIGQHIYLKDQNDNDYWVSTLPVSNIGDLSILETDKIDLTDYVLSSDLGAVATSNNYSDLNNLPNIPNSLSELSEDDNHKTITASKLAQIDSNTTAINSKLDKNLGSGNSNMGLITDDNGDIVTAPIGSTSFLVDNLESTATNLAPTANQVRILNNNKLDKQQGVENKGKILSVDNNGLITTIDNVTVPTKVSELQNDSDYATKSYVDTNGGKIDSISVNGVTQTITNKNVDIEIPTKTSDLTNDSNYATTTEVNNKVDKVNGKGLSTNDFTNEEKNKLASLENYDDTNLSGRVSTIESKIPNQASATNQLADKEFVNSSISTNTADFKGTVNSTNELPTTNVNINDYAFVITTDSNGNTLYNRYKYNTSNTWEFEYALNNSSFTASQWSAINSGATTTNIAQIGTNTTAISNLETNKADKTEIPTIPTSVDGMSGGTISSAVTVDGNIDGNYVTGTWLRTTQSGAIGSNYSSFFVNGDGWLYQRSKDAVKEDLGVPTKTSQLTNDSNFATTSQIPTNYVNTDSNQSISGIKTFNNDVAYKYTSTFYNANNNSTSSKCFGLYQWDDKFQYTYRDASTNTYQGTAFEVDGNNGVTDFSSRPTVNGSQVALKSEIPTKTSQLTNDSNYATTSDIPTQQEKEFLSGEYEKSVNLAKINSNSGLSNIHNFALNANIKSGKTYTLTLNTNIELNFNLKKNNISGTNLRTFYDVFNKFKYTFTADWNGDLFLNLFETSPTLTDIMLVEGENEIPYQPYNGPIVHEKDLIGEILWENPTINAPLASGVEFYYEKPLKEGDLIKIEYQSLWHEMTYFEEAYYRLRMTNGVSSVQINAVSANDFENLITGRKLEFYANRCFIYGGWRYDGTNRIAINEICVPYRIFRIKG